MPIKVAIIGNDDIAAYAYKAALDFGGCQIDVVTAHFADTREGSGWWYNWLPPKTTQNAPDSLTIHYNGNMRSYLMRCWEGRWAEYWMKSYPTGTQVVDAFNPDAVWETLWSNPSYLLIDHLSDAELVDFARYYDAVFLCRPTDKALATRSLFTEIPYAWVNPKRLRHLMEQELQSGMKLPIPNSLYADIKQGNNVLLLNGWEENTFPWIRLSLLWGKLFVEYPPHTPVETILQHWPGASVLVRKELHPNAEAWTETPAENVFLTGKFACYNPKLTRVHAYQQVQQVLTGIGEAMPATVEDEEEPTEQPIEEEPVDETEEFFKEFNEE